MKLRLRKLKSTNGRAAGKARGKGVRADPTRRVGVDNPEFTPVTTERVAVADERVKTSMVLLRSILSAAQLRARMEGMSLNAAFNQALFQWGMAQPDQLYPEGLVKRRLLSKGAILPPGMRQHARATARPTSVQDSGYTLPSEDPGHDADFAPWDVVERYAKAQLKHPTADFLKMAKRLNIPPGVARAADIAQESPEYRKYLQKKAKAS